MNEIATMVKALFDSTGGRNPPNAVEFWAMMGSPVPPGATEAMTQSCKAFQGILVYRTERTFPLLAFKYQPLHFIYTTSCRPPAQLPEPDPSMSPAIAEENPVLVL